MTDCQKTIKESFSIKGKGLHTGAEVIANFRPAPVNTGYIFKRVDIDGQPEIPALAENVVDTARGTVLAKGEAVVSTIEHSLAALYALGIDNCYIEVDGPEIPILDGSAKIFTEAILKAGVKEQQEAFKRYFEVKEKIVFKDEDKDSEIIILPDNQFSLNVQIGYESNVLFNQYAVLDDLKDFPDQIASCKTFVFLHEIEFLLKNNLVKGGDLSNALVIIDREVTQDELDRLADLFNQPHVKVKPQGVLNNTELLFDNEMARHKLLDVIGDLALCGQPIKGRVIATRPGHKTNTDAARVIRKAIKQAEKAIPVCNLNQEPLFDINDIKKMLPHRPPFLLVDKVMCIEGNTIVSAKNVTMNEPFFVGHFPEEPVMPGVLIVEAMAQSGGLLVLNQIDDPSKYSTYFLKIDNVKFRRKVIPGDTLIFKVEMTSPIRRGCANMRGLAYVGENVVTEAEFMAQIVKNK